MRLQRWRERRQAMGGTGRVAARVVLAVLPGCSKLAARAGTLLIHGTTHARAHLAQQGNTTSRLAVRTDHRGMVWGNLYDPVIRDNTAGGATFAPVKRDTKIRAAG